MKWSKRLAILCLAVFGMLSFVGCEEKEETETQTIVYHYGDFAISYGEFYIYAKTVEEDYQKTYGNGIWSLELSTENGKSSVKEVTIRDLISNINRVKVLVSHAEDEKVSLNDNERAEAENQASAFYNGLTEKDKEETQITRELVVQVIEENMLASKVYAQIISDYDFEISEEEARMTTFYDMVFECYEVKEDGTVEEYSEEKKAAQLERANEALSSVAQDEDVTYNTIVEKYNLEYSAEYTMSRAELIEEYGESVADKILDLSDGEVSVVIQTQYGYHIFKMLKAKDEELTKKNKAEIIAQKEREYFATVYQDWAKKYESHFNIEDDVDMELVNRFPFSEE